MIAGLRIEPAREADARELLALRRSILGEGSWFTTEPDELRETAGDRAELLVRARHAGNQVHLVARIGAELVGTLSIEGGHLRRVRHVGRLEMMVAGAHRGQGVGNELLTAGLRHARRTPALQKVELVVYAHNTRAIALYLRHGFHEEGRRRGQQHLPDGTWADEVWMARWLDAPPVSGATEPAQPDSSRHSASRR